MARMASRTLMDQLESASEGNEELDMMSWAFAEHLDWPLSMKEEMRFKTGDPQIDTDTPGPGM